MLYPIFGLVLFSALTPSPYVLYSLLFCFSWSGVWLYLSGYLQQPYYAVYVIILPFWVPFLVYLPEYLTRPVASWSLYFWIPFTIFILAFGLFAFFHLANDLKQKATRE